MSYIHGYDPDTLREQVDPRACKDRLDEIGEQRSLPALLERVQNSGAGILFVSLGCPKQEHWMARHADKLNLVMMGVGAAFDFHAGVVQRAPAWMQECGLEWLHRLAQDPRRLWRRYLGTNSRFVYEVVTDRLNRRSSQRRDQATRRRG